MGEDMDIKKTASEEAPEKRSVVGGIADLWRQLFLMSIGAAALAQDEMEKAVDKLVEQGEMAEQEGRRIVENMIGKQKQGVRRQKDKVDDYMEDALHKLNIPSRDDLRALEERIATLSAKIDKLERSEE